MTTRTEERTITHEHLDDAIEANLEHGGNNCNCILAQFGKSIFGEHADCTFSGGSTSKGCFRVFDLFNVVGDRTKEVTGRRIGSLTGMNDDEQWGMLNSILPLTFRVNITERKDDSL